MDSSSVKSEVLRRIDEEAGAWDALVAEVGSSRMDRPGAMGDWTFRDLVAHLTGWRRYSISRLEAALLGKGDAAAPWPNGLAGDDEINDWIRESSRSLTTEQVLRDHAQTYRHLRCVIEEMPDEVLANPGRFPWLEGEALADSIVSGRYFAHLHEEHEPDVRSWLSHVQGAAPTGGG